MKSNSSRRRRPSERFEALDRRQFLAVGSGTGFALLAGCVGSESTDGSTGTFRLLITDLPADIGDFETLNVTFEKARVFPADGDDDGSAADDADDTNGEQDDDDDAGDTNGDDGDANDDEDRGFYTLDLDGATVDLTTVVGDVAMPVFDGELQAGEYNKIELHVAETDATLAESGESADVKVPSEKLQITHSFTLEPDDTVDFVFDINVVQRGQGGSYNLRPVISGSGVNGADVDVEEIPGDDDGGEAQGPPGDDTRGPDGGEADDADTE